MAQVQVLTWVQDQLITVTGSDEVDAVNRAGTGGNPLRGGGLSWRGQPTQGGRTLRADMGMRDMGREDTELSGKESLLADREEESCGKLRMEEDVC